MPLSRGCPLKILPHNQQRLLKKWGKQDFDEHVHRVNLMVKGRIGKLTHKHPPRKKN
jgi:hypothetical protein